MNKFDEYIKESNIVYMICKTRAKYAKKRNEKHLIYSLSGDKDLNYHTDNPNNEEEKKLSEILPSRKKWKKVNKDNRYNKKGQRINSVKYNTLSLQITINWYRKNKPEEPFLIELDKFIKEIIDAINDKNYKIKTPELYPILKGDKKNEETKEKNICRPISIYSLKDRIILSIVNKYLTDFFDDSFYEKSFAFRSSKVERNHHSSIHEILEHKSNYKGKRLWVSECDISKFYDSVNHTIIKKLFIRLLKKVEYNTQIFCDERASNLFYKYLQSYSFVKDVLPFNDKKSERYNKYWNKFNISNGEFGWVRKEIIALGFYKKSGIGKAKIGIPQGGALSGLIANIVLDYADRQILKISDNKLFYTRFCDDMVIIHTSKKKCNEAALIYEKALKELKLVPHEFKRNLKNTPDSFWSKKIKSKSPYKWSSEYQKSFPWFGFVGYEIHYDGILRVRKKSMKKELDKQKEVIDKIIDAVKKQKRKTNGTIIESAVNRLVGMSVGRVEIWNYDKIENEMCWVNGFNKLKPNKYLKSQLKQLDRNRNYLLDTLWKELSDYKLTENIINRLNNKGVSIEICEALKILIDNVYTDKEMFIIDIEKTIGKENRIKYQGLILSLSIYNKPIDDDKESNNRPIIYYGKPFSYYYHIIEKEKNNKNPYH